MDIAVRAKLSALASRVQVKMRNALRSERIPQNRVHQPQVELPGDVRLPVGLREVLQHPGHFDRMALPLVLLAAGKAGFPIAGKGRSQPQRAQISRVPGKVQRSLHRAQHRLRLAPNNAQAGRACLQVIGLRLRAIGRNVAQHYRDVARIQIQQLKAILEVEACRAILVVQHTLPHQHMPRLKVEQRVQNRLARRSRFARLGQIG